MKLSGSRCLLVWCAATALAVVALTLLAPEVAAAPQLARDQGTSFDQWLVAGCTAATIGCVVWGWLVTTVVVVQAHLGRSRPAASPMVPTWARRAVLLACGLAVVGANAGPVHASDGGDGEAVVRLLDGLPLPDRAEGPSVAQSIGRQLSHAARSAAPAPTHVVLQGESLWSIAEQSLRSAGRRADPAAVTRHWHQIHARNHTRIGADPDLIHPGQRLRLPRPGKEPR